MENYINANFEKAINDYLNSKNSKSSVSYNSFMVTVIRALVFIYGELDIITPFNNKDVITLHDNLLKFNLSKFQLNQFFNEVRVFEKIDVRDSIINIEKALIEMFICKKMYYEVTELEIEEFKKYIVSSDNDNMILLSYAYLYNLNNVILKYYIERNESSEKISVDETKKLLSPEAYKIVNQNYTDVCLLSAQEVEQINNLVYKSLNVNKNAVNFDYLYDLALFNYYNKNHSISGNGYVDILLLMGFISTCVMILSIVIFIFMM